MSVKEAAVASTVGEFLDAVKRGLAEVGVEVSPGTPELLSRHFLMVEDWNTRINLTGIVSPVEAAIKHYVDSLSCFLAFQPGQGASLVDVGSGAGFPGVPLKIARPDVAVSLMESNGKKAGFLREVCREIPLEGANVLQTRAEEAGRDVRLRASFDVGVARAVGELRVLAEYVLPLVKVGGVFLAQKGPDLDQETVAARQALAILGGEVETVTRFDLPEGMGQRCVVVIRKTKPTENKYPRRPGVPAKKPL